MEVDLKVGSVEEEFDVPLAPSEGRADLGDRSPEGEGEGMRSLSDGIESEGALGAGIEGSGPEGGFVLGRVDCGRADGEAMFGVRKRIG